jgi:hypothetical protein
VSTGRRTIGLGSRRFTVLFASYVVGLGLTVTMLLSGFHWDLRPVAPAQAGGTASEVDTTAIVGIRTFDAPGDAVIEEDVVYATEPDGTQLTLDGCRGGPGRGDRSDGSGGGTRSSACRDFGARRQLGPWRQGQQRLAQRL